MARKTVLQCLDLRQPDINVERFADALVVHHICLLIDSGGKTLGRYDLDDSIDAEHLRTFVERAVINAQLTHRFASDCYAVAAAHSYYQFDCALQAWLMNGYMVAWRQHFFPEEEAE
jgi:hypothetical protein